MPAHPSASAAAISKVVAMLSLAARRRPTVLAMAASGCDAMLHASSHRAAALPLSQGVVWLLASSRKESSRIGMCERVDVCEHRGSFLRARVLCLCVMLCGMCHVVVCMQSSYSE